MNDINREHAQNRLANNRLYPRLRKVSQWLDRYYIDALAGVIPGGLGDIGMALFSLVYVYFGAFVVKSPALTVALLNNIIRDVLVGLIPFYVGDVLDFFYRSNVRNMALIDGFVQGDKEMIDRVNRRVWFSVAVMVMLLGMVAAMLWLVYWLASQAVGLFA